jgi:putative endonuclease
VSSLGGPAVCNVIRYKLVWGSGGEVASALASVQGVGHPGAAVWRWRRLMAWVRLHTFWRQLFRPADTGSQGERLAEAYLQRRCGFISLARNWRNPADEREEIDLVMRDRDVLVFIEVKARSTRALVPGYFAVTPRKKKVLRRACGAYLRQLRPRPRTFRFDVVEVEFPEKPHGDPIVRHFEHVPLFSKGFRF